MPQQVIFKPILAAVAKGAATTSTYDAWTVTGRLGEGLVKLGAINHFDSRDVRRQFEQKGYRHSTGDWPPRLN
ncbi:hypothetical protein C8R41DRAFT_817067 [Lentinula lateritia]|uniref:Uncharacterized protein n=1 Tax=Lentinula lateritia TaxID=40482 RepID=A0ABQ8VRG1_9AGAR|nr:hypothetical protein C8R41DRAFT_817067 [Lentinula lateritia]